MDETPNDKCIENQTLCHSTLEPYIGPSLSMGLEKYYIVSSRPCQLSDGQMVAGDWITIPSGIYDWIFCDGRNYSGLSRETNYIEEWWPNKVTFTFSRPIELDIEGEQARISAIEESYGKQEKNINELKLLEQTFHKNEIEMGKSKWWQFWNKINLQGPMSFFDKLLEIGGQISDWCTMIIEFVTESQIFKIWHFAVFVGVHVILVTYALCNIYCKQRRTVHIIQHVDEDIPLLDSDFGGRSRHKSKLGKQTNKHGKNSRSLSTSREYEEIPISGNDEASEKELFSTAHH